MYIIDFLLGGLRSIFVDNLPITLTVLLGLAAIYLLLPSTANPAAALPRSTG